jgi:YVTN family beta-propeller protein
MRNFGSPRWRHQHRRVLRRTAAAGVTVAFVGAITAAVAAASGGGFGNAQVGTANASGVLLPTNQYVQPLGTRLLVNNGRLLSSTISPNGEFLAALTWNDFTGFLTIIDLKTQRIVQQIGTGTTTDPAIGDGSVAADGPLYSADGKSLWFPQSADIVHFAVGTDGTVSTPVVISLAKDVDNLTTGQKVTADLPSGMALTADGSLLYVALNGVNKLGVINTSTNLLVKTIPVGNAPRQVVLVGGHAFVSNEGAVRRNPDNSPTTPTAPRSSPAA